MKLDSLLSQLLGSPHFNRSVKGLHRSLKWILLGVGALIVLGVMSMVLVVFVLLRLLFSGPITVPQIPNIEQATQSVFEQGQQVLQEQVPPEAQQLLELQKQVEQMQQTLEGSEASGQ